MQDLPTTLHVLLAFVLFGSLFAIILYQTAGAQTPADEKFPVNYRPIDITIGNTHFVRLGPASESYCPYGLNGSSVSHLPQVVFWSEIYYSLPPDEQQHYHRPHRREPFNLLRTLTVEEALAQEAKPRR
jgi:hypothetical protein